MSSTPLPRRLAALALAALPGASPALAAPPPWANNDKDKGEQHEVVAGGRHFVRHGGHFNDVSRQTVREYYAQGKRCPPGLAKKNNGCMPPGQARKWHVGQPIPRDVRPAPVPRDVLVLLPALPPGHQYVSHAGDILLIAASSRMVVDAITVTVTVR